MIGARCKETDHDLRASQIGTKGTYTIVDLKGMVLVTREGENAFLELINRGAKIRPEGVLVKHILQQLARRSRK